MPLYEYQCSGCGTFSQTRPVSESGAMANCPSCGALAAKLFPLVNLRSMRPENRVAWQRNEQSTHAPHVCGAGCAHRSTKPVKKSGKRFQASTKKNSRPWMLGH